uniref:Uncharacterized protein n=1 Tax=Megaselia scalaris TaxID=36166 RepID=T1H0M4_MEGSC
MDFCSESYWKRSGALAKAQILSKVSFVKLFVFVLNSTAIIASFRSRIII